MAIPEKGTPDYTEYRNSRRLYWQEILYKKQIQDVLDHNYSDREPSTSRKLRKLIRKPWWPPRGRGYHKESPWFREIPLIPPYFSKTELDYFTDLTPEHYHNGVYLNETGRFHTRAQIFVEELVKENQVVAIEGKHGIGKDTAIAKLQNLVGKEKIEPAKVSGFIAKEERDFYLSRLPYELRKFFENMLDFIDVSLPVKYPYTVMDSEYMKQTFQHLANLYDIEPDDIHSRQFGWFSQYCNYFFTNIIEPHKPGFRSYYLLQSIYLAHLNSMQKYRAIGKPGIVVTNGGVLQNTMMNAEKREYKLRQDVPLTCLSRGVYRSTIPDDRLYMRSDAFEVAIPTPPLTIYLQAPDDVVERRIREHAEKGTEVEKRVRSMRHYGPWLDKFAERWHNDQDPDTQIVIIDASDSANLVSERIAEELRRRGILT